MDLRLQGKRALVTGSSIGLGEAIARALAAEGVAVAIHGRQPKRTYAVAADIEAHGGRVAVVLGDLTVEGEAQNIADSAIEQLGGIDILVNNAGGTGEKLVWEDTPIRAWTESYERNVPAAVRLIQSSSVADAAVWLGQDCERLERGWCNASARGPGLLSEQGCDQQSQPVLD
jgi:3-oxoacyl-[acyl-carrier protein] reductase